MSIYNVFGLNFSKNYSPDPPSEFDMVIATRRLREVSFSELEWNFRPLDRGVSSECVVVVWSTRLCFHPVKPKSGVRIRTLRRESCAGLSTKFKASYQITSVFIKSFVIFLTGRPKSYLIFWKLNFKFHFYQKVNIYHVTLVWEYCGKHFNDDLNTRAFHNFGVLSIFFCWKFW